MELEKVVKELSQKNGTEVKEAVISIIIWRRYEQEIVFASYVMIIAIFENLHFTR